MQISGKIEQIVGLDSVLYWYWVLVLPIVFFSIGYSICVQNLDSLILWGILYVMLKQNYHDQISGPPETLCAL